MNFGTHFTMDSNLLRQKISELTKKYSNKKVSIDDDLSLSDDYSFDGNGTVKYRSKPGDEATNDAVNNINSSHPVIKSTLFEPKSPKVVTPKSGSSRGEIIKERDQFIDTPRSRSINSEGVREHLDSLNSPQGITQRSRSVSEEVDNFSDLFSDEELENPQEIDEDSDDSSEYHPFKNIHLVSDDILEDIHTDSEASINSENIDERLTNRSTRSTPRSIRSIPLSPFISPPVTGKKSEVKIKGVTSENESLIEEQLENDDHVSKIYESSFEEVNESSESGEETLKKSNGSGSGTSKNRTSSSRRSNLSSNSGKTNQDFETSTSASIVKTPSESSVQEVSLSHSLKISSEKSDNVEEIPESDTSKSGQHLDSSRSRIPGRGEGHGKIAGGGEKRGERPREEGGGGGGGGKRGGGIQIETSELNKSDDNFSEVISEIQDLDIRDQQKSISSPAFDDLEKSKEDSKVKEDRRIENRINKKSTKFLQTTGPKHKVSKLKKSNKHVQCDLISDRLRGDFRGRTPIVYVSNSSFREENILNPIQPRRKPLNIDTRVKNLPDRPVITTNIDLFEGNKCLKNDLDFHIDCDNRIEDYDLNPTIAMDKILRNQIHLTKYFMESHHKMYMACCKIVKSMNEDYENNGLVYDNR